MYDDITEEVGSYIKENYKGIYTRDLVEMIRRDLGKNCDPVKVRNYKHARHLSSGVSGRYNVGRKNPNKGKKLDERARKKLEPTMFKSGQKPHNYLPVGSIRFVTGCGYYKIKIGEPNKWTSLARWTWEQAHGEIPKGYVVFHINGITTDDRLENLTIITRAEQMNISRRGLIVKGNEEINKAVITLGKLDTKTYERIREK